MNQPTLLGLNVTVRACVRLDAIRVILITRMRLTRIMNLTHHTRSLALRRQ